MVLTGLLLARAWAMVAVLLIGHSFSKMVFSSFHKKSILGFFLSLPFIFFWPLAFLSGEGRRVMFNYLDEQFTTIEKEN